MIHTLQYYIQSDIKVVSSYLLILTYLCKKTYSKIEIVDLLKIIRLRIYALRSKRDFKLTLP